MAHMPIIPALSRLTQEDYNKLQASPVYMVSSGLARVAHQDIQNCLMQIAKWQEMSLRKETTMTLWPSR